MTDLVTVFESTDVVLLAIAESALREADIRYVVQNRLTQSLFGLGQMGGHNFITGPVRVQVTAEDAEAARELLADLDGDASPEGAA